jgi:hypothetical protein
MCSPDMPDPPDPVAVGEAPEAATVRGRKRRTTGKKSASGLSGLRIGLRGGPGAGMGGLLSALLIPGGGQPQAGGAVQGSSNSAGQV